MKLHEDTNIVYTVQINIEYWNQPMRKVTNICVWISLPGFKCYFFKE